MTTRTVGRGTGVFAAAVLAAAAGCATTGDTPVQQLTEARSSIEQAEQNGAREHAPAVLNAAREKLQRAEALAAEGERERARRAAIEAEADAELASAQALRAQNREAAQEIEESLQTLENELRRERS